MYIYVKCPLVGRDQSAESDKTSVSICMELVQMLILDHLLTKDDVAVVPSKSMKIRLPLSSALPVPSLGTNRASDW
jgi:hypothetical protein